MPVPVWDHSTLDSLEESLDNTTTVVSEDIWKKFDLDVPLDIYDQYDYRSIDDGLMPSDFFLHDKMTCSKSREIRHHDCMWAGLCISKEHNRMLTVKKELQVQKKVPAGRSLLISRTNQSVNNDNNGCNNDASVSTNKEPIAKEGGFKKEQLDGNENQCMINNIPSKGSFKSTDNDGYSRRRADTPPSSAFNSCTEEEEDDDDDDDDDEEEEEEEEDDEKDYHNDHHQHDDKEIPVFKHDQISIHERLSECMLESPAKAVPVSEVTGQLVRRPVYHHHHRQQHQQQQPQQFCNRRKLDGCRSIDSTREDETDVRNTLNDHSYYLNQPSSKELEHLGVQTPSGSDEEIDVVTFDKPCKSAAVALWDYSSLDNHRTKLQHSQLTEKIAFIQNKTTATPRRRGRPPSSMTSSKKITPQQQQSQHQHQLQSEKRGIKQRNQRNYQRRKECTSPPSTLMSPNSKSSSEDEFNDDEEKKNLHNNMERQRRIELRKLFEELRRLVPEIACKDNTPKVEILKKAAGYCNTLTKVAKLKRKQKRLRARLRELRINQAMTRWKE